MRLLLDRASYVLDLWAAMRRAARLAYSVKWCSLHETADGDAEIPNTEKAATSHQRVAFEVELMDLTRVRAS